MKNGFRHTGLLLCLLLIGAPFRMQAQSQHTDFLTIGVENGLSNSSVTCIIQDSIGFLWIGTKHGLNRYDGTNFKLYSPKQPNQIGNDISVLHIDSRNRFWVGTNSDGLFLYHALTDQFQQVTLPGPSLPKGNYLEIHTLFEDPQGLIWIGTQKGLYSYDSSGKSKHYPLVEQNYGSASNPKFDTNAGSGFNSGAGSHPGPDSDVSNKNDIRAIIEAPNNCLWIGTFGSGLYLFDKQSGKFTCFNTASFSGLKENSDYINALFTEKNGNLLVGTNGQGLKLIDFQQRKVSNYLSNTAYNDLTIVRCIWQDKHNDMWIGTDGMGILKITRLPGQPPLIKNYQTNHSIHNSLSSNTINVFFEDRQSNLWIGTAKQGVNLIKKQPTHIEYYYGDGKGEYKIPILSVFHDRNGLWMGTDGEGLVLLKEAKDAESPKAARAPKDTKEAKETRNKRDPISPNQNLPESVRFLSKMMRNGYVGDFIQCIKPCIDNDGCFWLGMYAKGIYHFDYNTQKSHHSVWQAPVPSTFIPLNNVQDILTLASGDLWIATWGDGLIYFDTKAQLSWTYKHEPNNPESLGSDNVLAICLDPSGYLWLATYGDGLSMYNPITKKFKNYKVESHPELTSNYINGLQLGDDNDLWLATKEGIVRLDLATLQFTPISMDRTDEQRRNIVSLVKDRKGNIWAGTEKGIACIRKGDYRQVYFIPEVFDNFRIKSAFAGNDGNDEKLYFGSNERVIAFRPSQIEFKTSVPTMCFTDFKLFNKPVAIGGKSVLSKQICFENRITLKHNQSVVTIEYAALDYSLSKNINYEVKLEGSDQEWHNVGSQNAVTYTNLPSGTYTFMVRPTGEPSYRDTPPAQLTLRILPPIWLTWWAYLIYLGLIIGVLYLFRRYTLTWANIKNELKLEKLKREQETFKREQEVHIYELKQRFFINISHDIRTPLTLIAGSINKLFNQANTNITDQKHLKMIRTNTNRLLNLTGELLNFRKLETGNITLQVSEENLVEFVQEIYISYTQFAINKQIKYEFEYTQAEIGVWIDKIQFEKAVCNLISNAFKYTPEGGEITLKVALNESGEVSVTVLDTGKGMEAEEVERIFNRFYQVKQQSESDGFGIGLSIAREIVHLHGGRIEVESTVGKGSAFSIWLHPGKDHLSNVEFVPSTSQMNVLSEYFENPESLVDKGRDVQAVPPATQEVKSTLVKSTLAEPTFVDSTLMEKVTSILLIEDNPDIRAYLTDLLSAQYSIYEAANGQEGLSRAIELVPDLIISDVMMPIMDGITFCRKLKSDMRTSHIPVILLTARTLVDSIIEGFETGADEYLTKPFNERVLLTRVNNLLQNRKRIREQISKEIILNPQEISLNSQDEIFLSQLVSYIETHIEEPELNIAQMASHMAMSHSNLYKKVKALTGMTVIGFVKDFRLKRAAQLLAQNQLNITEIAYLVGYSERRYFSDDFKKKFNLSPREYAEKYK